MPANNHLALSPTASFNQAVSQGSLPTSENTEEPLPTRAPEGQGVGSYTLAQGTAPQTAPASVALLSAPTPATVLPAPAPNSWAAAQSAFASGFVASESTTVGMVAVGIAAVIGGLLISDLISGGEAVETVEDVVEVVEDVVEEVVEAAESVVEAVV